MKYFFFALVLLCLLPSLTAAQSPLIHDMVNSVSADSLVATMLRLQGFGTRFEYTPQQDSAGEFLLQEHLRRGISAVPQNYTFGTTRLNDIQFVSPDTGWICDVSGFIVRTTDGGASWINQDSPAPGQLNCLHFVNGQTGWSGGAKGAIIHTTDGGAHWTDQWSGTTRNINDIAFLNENMGLAVGDTGKILRTANGGVTWDSVSIVLSSNLMSVSYLDSLHAWAAGTRGVILVSSNGGQTWTRQTSGTTASFYSVAFTSPLTGYTAGAGATLLKTTNGGVSWVRMPVPVSGNINRVRFTDSLRGWALSRSYKLLRTLDGGATWDTSFSILSDNWGPLALALDVTKAGHLAVCGSRSSIYTSNDNGMTWQERTDNLPSWYLHPSANIVATITGKVNPQREVLVVGHYDSYSSTDPYNSAPGANDNASGTSAVMEAARICSKYDFESTLIFMAVSGEELGMMGSWYAAKKTAAEGHNIAAVVNGDMIGYATTSDTAMLAISSYMQHNWLIDTAGAVNQRYGIGLTLMTALDSTGASDYAPFAQVGYDALELEEDVPAAIWGGADPYYHTPMDLVANLRPSLVRRGAQLMLAVAAEVARPLSLVSVEPATATTPVAWQLSQNYPNPFNPVTTINYTIGQSEDYGTVGLSEGGRNVLVQLSVYDLLGRQVATLVNERQGAGVHQVSFNAASLPSGAYFYRLQAGGFMQVKRMMLVK